MFLGDPSREAGLLMMATTMSQLSREAVAS